MVAVPPPVMGTTTVPEERGLKSEMPLGDGKVVKSITRKRNRVIFPLLLFVYVRRTESVPKVELLAGSLVKSRTTLGESVSACAGSRTESAMSVPTVRGPDKFSGPAAPR